MDGACVAGEVFVVDGAAEEVGYCFLAAVGVIGEACADGYGAVRKMVGLVRVTCEGERLEPAYK